jgi:hypothetical protein
MRRLLPSVTLPDRATLAFALILIGAYSWLFVYFPRLNNPNEQVRLYLIRAIVEDGSLSIGRRVLSPKRGWVDGGHLHHEWGFVNDKALVCDDSSLKPPDCEGPLYAAKAPGLALLGVPVYATMRAVWRALDVHPEVGRPSRTEMTLALRWSLVVLPSILTWLALRAHLRRRLRQPLYGDAVALAGALGSLSLTYGQLFAGHQPCALALAWAYLLVDDPKGPSGARAFLAGFAGALAVSFEYPAAPAFLCIGAWFLMRRPSARALGLAIAGAAIPTAVVAAYHAAAFGAAWSTPYAHLENPLFIEDIDPGFLGISLPTWEKVSGGLWSPFTGLYFFAPWLLLMWIATPFVFRRAHTAADHGLPWWRSARGAALAAIAICAYYLLFQITHALWRGGWVVGPRYITPIVPFAAIAIAHGLDAAPARLQGVLGGLLAGLGATAIFVTGTCSAVSQGFPIEFYNPLFEVALPLLERGYVARNPLMSLGVPGPWSAAPYFLALGLGAVGLLVVGLRAAPRWRWAVPIAAAVALGLSLAYVDSDRAPPARHKDEAFEFLRLRWEPPSPPGAG